MSDNTKDVLLAVTPALFGLIGTAVGAGVAYRASTAERLAKEDSEARQRLAAITDAIHGASRFIRLAPSLGTTDPKELARAVWKAVSEGRAALLTAGIPYRITFTALGPAEILAIRLDALADEPAKREGDLGAAASRSVDNSQASVVFLAHLLDRRRGYRRSRRAWRRLKRMPEVAVSAAFD